VPARQLVFGSHSPFLVTAASVAKLATAQLSAGQRQAISAGNLERFLRS
jgi:predicted TIM-barrel fold metal-dependent hydrolase